MISGLMCSGPEIRMPSKVLQLLFCGKGFAIDRVQKRRCKFHGPGIPMSPDRQCTTSWPIRAVYRPVRSTPPTRRIGKQIKQAISKRLSSRSALQALMLGRRSIHVPAAPHISKQFMTDVERRALHKPLQSVEDKSYLSDRAHKPLVTMPFLRDSLVHRAGRVAASPIRLLQLTFRNSA